MKILLITSKQYNKKEISKTKATNEVTMGYADHRRYQYPPYIHAGRYLNYDGRTFHALCRLFHTAGAIADGFARTRLPPSYRQLRRSAQNCTPSSRLARDRSPIGIEISIPSRMVRASNESRIGVLPRWTE